MIIKGLLLNISPNILIDNFVTIQATEEYSNLFTNFMENNVGITELPFNVVILDKQNNNFSLIKDISYISKIEYKEPSEDAGEENNWYLLLSNDPLHFQLRSSGLIAFKYYE